jgi:hypothetical protein
MLPKHPPLNRDPESVTALVQTVFREVWNEFYVWEQKHCREAISSLAGRIPTNKSRGSIVETLNKNIELINDSKVRREPEDSTIIAPKLDLPPYPTYEACTPVSGNIWKGDDSPHMPFVPCADEPDFDQIEHSMAYENFAWQNGNRDPDRQYIKPNVTLHDY